MADEEVTETAAPTSFKEFEAAGGKYNPPAEPAKPAPAEPVEEAKAAEPEAEPAEQPETEPAEKKPAKQKLSLTEERAKLLAEVTELRRQRRELQQPPATSQPVPPANQNAPTPAARPERPDLATWTGTFADWQAADTKWMREEMRAERADWFKEVEEREAKQRAEIEQKRIAQTYHEKLAAHVKEHPDYEEGLGRMAELPPHIQQACLRTGPELTQALIDDPEATRRILALQPADQLFEIGKLAARLSSNGNGHAAEPTAETPQPVKVPARLNATGSSASVTAKPDHGAKSFAQWEEIERRLAKRK
jgi:hypothetical protein